MIDGIPLLRAPGPPRAGLVFRVGRADETPARTGLSHLVAHLVRARVPQAGGNCGGASPVVTAFTTKGSAAETAAFLNGVCAALTSPSEANLAAAKAEMWAEAAGRVTTVLDSLDVVRFGARHHGLAGLPEWGLHALTADDVREWIAAYFTRENAALWISGPEVPAGLRLALPSGVRRPVPAADPLTGGLGAFRPTSRRTIARDQVLPAGLATAVYASVLERALFRATGRAAGDGAHRVGSHYRPRGDGSASVVVLAEMVGGDAGPIVGEFTDTLYALRMTGVPAEDVAAVITEHERALTRPEAAANRLPEQAFALLTGDSEAPFSKALISEASFSEVPVSEVPVSEAPVSGALISEVPVAELRARLRTITADRINALAAGSQASELLLDSWSGPVGVVPTAEEPVPFGRRFPSLESRRAALVLDKTSITRTWPGIPPVTVPFAAAAVLLTWPDGGRRLVRADARHVDIESTLHETTPDLVPAIDAAVPADRHASLPPRDPGSIPAPEPRGRRPLRYGAAGSLLLGLAGWAAGGGSVALILGTDGAIEPLVAGMALLWVAGLWGSLRLRRVRNTIVADRRLIRARRAAALSIGSAGHSLSARSTGPSKP
ncbi:hypothetical protein ACIA8K_13700 [Catenuloplanes sp. NPDC051500]|uniref:hypothetical protein n=1 Tax=Catenuloplanes sp. NPDC051500 TaxID=3363959 RepID=UPI0037A039D3